MARFIKLSNGSRVNLDRVNMYDIDEDGCLMFVFDGYTATIPDEDVERVTNILDARCIKPYEQKFHLKDEYLPVKDYLEMPYHVTISREKDEGYDGYFADVEELEGCMTQADTWEELEEMLLDAMKGWIELTQEHGHPLPLPRKE